MNGFRSLTNTGQAKTLSRMSEGSGEDQEGNCSLGG